MSEATGTFFTIDQQCGKFNGKSTINVLDIMVLYSGVVSAFEVQL